MPYRITTDNNGRLAWWEHGEPLPPEHIQVRLSNAEETGLIDDILAADRAFRMPAARSVQRLLELMRAGAR